MNNGVNNINNGVNNTNNANNGMNNINNGMNNISNANNGMNNISNANTVKKKNNLIPIIIGIVVVVIIIVFIISKFGGSFLSSHKNTTGSSKYKDSDVTFNCTYNQDQGDYVLTKYEDYLFNYDGFQLELYKKMILEYDNLTDDVYYDYMKKLGCDDIEGKEVCMKDYIELALTSRGWDTVVTRDGNTVTVTSMEMYGLGQTYTDSQIEEYMDSVEKNGFTCK